MSGVLHQLQRERNAGEGDGREDEDVDVVAFVAAALVAEVGVADTGDRQRRVRAADDGVRRGAVVSIGANTVAA